MTETTIRAHKNTGSAKYWVSNSGADWAALRALTSGTAAFSSLRVWADDSGGTYEVKQGFLEFDLTPLAGELVTAASLSMFPFSVSGSWLILVQEAKDYDTDENVLGTYWETAAQVEAGPLIGSFAPEDAVGGTFVIHAFPLTDVAAINARIADGDPLRLILVPEAYTVAAPPPSGTREWLATNPDYQGAETPSLVLTHETAPTTVATPDIVGNVEATGLAALSAAGLIAGVRTTSYSGTVALGSIISQDPAAGVEVLIGSAVDYVVSLGPVPAPVPPRGVSASDNAPTASISDNAPEATIS